jgi:hypothetical protein
MDNTQRTAFLVTTGITIILILFGGGEGFAKQFRQPNPEMWIYALAESAGTAFVCLLTYIAFGVADIARTKNRIAGWLLCGISSVGIIFVFKYILPAPKPLF